MIPDNRFTDEEIQKRFETHCGDNRDFSEGQIPYLREKLCSLSEFICEIKVGFARYDNRRHNRRDYFWGGRFKSVIVEKGETLINCLAYYEAGASNRPDKMQAKVIEDKVVAKERKKEFEISCISRFRYRTHYFIDSGIIGSKEFVDENYQRFKHLFYSKHEKKPKPIKGLKGVYSLKRLSEMI